MRIPYTSEKSAAARQWWLSVVLLVLLAGCHGHSHNNSNHDGDTLTFRHSSLLRGLRTNSFTQMEVADPWDTSKLIATYILVPSNQELPRTLPAGIVIRTPLQQAVAFSAVHAALAEELGCLNRISGLCDTDYACGETLRQILKRGILKDFGPAMQPVTERIVAAHADALLISPFRDHVPGPAERLGIPVIACADYMENSPLGQAEWMRFYGMLFGCEQKADSLFKKVEQEYKAWTATAKKSENKPTLMVDLKTGPVWYVAGGCSTMGTLYRDAGLRYLFADLAESGSVALDFERVYARCAEAEWWFVKYGETNNKTYATLAQDDPRYRRFRPWEARKIIGCNTLGTPFYEETPFHPERLLSEFVQTFHPELRGENFTPRYLRPLAE